MAGHVDIGLGRGGVARRMIVHHDDGRGMQGQGPPHHLARVQRRVIDGALLLDFVADQHVLAVQKQQAKLFGAQRRHGGAAIVQQIQPRRQHRVFADRGAGQPNGGLAHDLQNRGRVMAQALGFHQIAHIGGQTIGKTAPAVDHRLGQRFDILARNHRGQQQFQNLVVGQGVGRL